MYRYTFKAYEQILMSPNVRAYRAGDKSANQLISNGY